MGWGWWVIRTQLSRSLWPHTTLYTELCEVSSKTSGRCWAPEFIRTSNVHISFQIAASVLRHQGQHRTSCSPVPQTRDVALHSARLTKVPPAGKGTRVRLRQTLKNVLSHITLNIGEIIKEKLPKPSENDFGYLLSSCLKKIQEWKFILLTWLKII